MSATLVAVEQAVAQFALHALWQVPLLALAAWFAVRLGRPAVRAAHVVWVATLVLCVVLPLFSTVNARHAAAQAARDGTQVSIRFDDAAYDPMVPAMQREAAWQRLLRRHFSRQRGLVPFFLTVPPAWARGVAGVYLLFAVIFLLRLLTAWRRVRGIVRASSALPLQDAFSALLRKRCAQTGLAVPEVRSSDAIAGPALAGVLRPVLLLPTKAALLLDGPEMEAVLLHEVAHLERHDPAMHALCSLLLLPLCFHPAGWWTARQIRQTREMACDARAAASLGSSVAYAHALLHIAERIGYQPAEHRVLNFFSNGLFGATLELFNGSGAMEERMQKLIENRPEEGRGSRALRAVACVSVCAAAVLAAGLLQVRPALAGERSLQSSTTDNGARLLSGDHAREQLQQARRALTEAEQKATNNDDRRRITTARGIAAMAEQAIADVDRSRQSVHPVVDLSTLQVQLADLKVQTDLLNSPEWKARMEQQQRDLEQLRERLASPGFRKEIEDASRIDVPHMEAILRDAKQQQAQALEQIRSGAFQRQIEQANRMVARNVIPVLPVEAADAVAEQPVKVSPAVMSGNVTHREAPIYPAEAKEKKIQGAVLLHAIIGEQGSIEQLSVISSPDEMLSKSALDAVHQWTYKPYLLNGQPTAVDTTITVTYSFTK
ncbi:MAG: TonB family protein [Janthinobacterium lividum]